METHFGGKKIVYIFPLKMAFQPPKSGWNRTKFLKKIKLDKKVWKLDPRPPTPPWKSTLLKKCGFGVPMCYRADKSWKIIPCAWLPDVIYTILRIVFSLQKQKYIINLFIFFILYWTESFIFWIMLLKIEQLHFDCCKFC